MTMADTVAVMNGGRVEQLGSPADLYENPRTTFVANFLGTSNLIEAEVATRGGGEVVLKVTDGRIALPEARCPAGGKVLIGVRPEKIAITHTDDETAVSQGRNRLRGTIADASFIGVSTQYVIRTAVCPEFAVYVQNVHRDVRLAPGADVVLHWAPEHTFGLDASQDIDAGTEEEAVV